MARLAENVYVTPRPVRDDRGVELIVLGEVSAKTCLHGVCVAQYVQDRLSGDLQPLSTA
jgi:hypothetical protein